MGYEDAPATVMLATFCACCSRPLVDATSVECGIGPECRKKYRLPELDESTRIEANKLVNEIARLQQGDVVEENIERLEAMGCDVIAARCRKRLFGKDVVITLDGDTLSVKSPYNELAIAPMRGVPGRKWDGGAKVNTFPIHSADAILAVLGGHYAGQSLRVGDGIFVCKPGLTAADVGLPVVEAPKAGTPKAPSEIKIKIVRDMDAERIAVYTPYDADVVASFKAVGGRRWDGPNKVNTFPMMSEGEVMGIVAHAFPNIVLEECEGQVLGAWKPSRGRSRARGYGRRVSHDYDGYGR